MRLSRRQVVQGAGTVGLGLLAGCGRLPWQEQPPAKVPRIGFLSGTSAVSGAAAVEAFRQGLREHGYVEGQNIVVDYRFAEAEADQRRALAAELVQLPVDVIVTAGTLAVRAAKDATATIPIVVARGDDLVAFGLVASLARPGGNVTGLSTIALQLSQKRLELLKEAVPGASRVAVFWNPAIPERASEFSELASVAEALGVQLQSLEVSGTEGFESAFEAATRERADALLTLDNALTSVYRSRLVDLALRSRLPMISADRALAEAGGLMSYGPNFNEQYRRAAYYVDRILRGAKPADLPVEQPSTFDFAINLKTAQALGLTIPHHVLLQATEIIP
jgi:putative tryptophan/tyrosine transport system substrate-binding protein